MSTCWCGDTHEPKSDDVEELLRHLGHEIIAALRIPQLVDWLTRRTTT